ncbi:hypothetical protein BLNAU_1506 [Blattamonas nauphoetae]|uniref:Uncharacterized protein n=1 Tax=Blattamonas nauphoetae TaxID=2049346 RepID=A0ABQ9YI86_9EUKA|nr:hypothetical protein BLNAU_1506 [Blattamonas nauphoetae]
MEEEKVALNTANDACLNPSPESHSTVNGLHNSFLNSVPNTDLTFEDKSTIYCSFVALVKDNYHFDDALQDKATQFLKSLEPKWDQVDLADKLVTDLVPSSTRSHSGFISTTVQPHTLQISGHETIIDNLFSIINQFVYLAHPSYLKMLNITSAVDSWNHCEMIFQKVVIPSSQFVMLLLSNRDFLESSLTDSLMNLLGVLLRMGPFHRPTLEFLLDSPCVMVFSSRLSLVEVCPSLWETLIQINDSLEEWKKPGPEEVQSGKQMIRALIAEGFENTIEQVLMHAMDANSLQSHHAYFCVLSSKVKCFICVGGFAIVKEKYPFDNVLQARAAKFLKSLEPKWNTHGVQSNLMTDLTPSSAGSPSDFVESILPLLSSPHSTLIAAALSLLNTMLLHTPYPIRYSLMQSDLIRNVLSTIQPQKLPIAGNKTLIHHLSETITFNVRLAHVDYLARLRFEAAVNTRGYREMIFQTVVLPSSQFVQFLIQNRRLFHGESVDSFMTLLHSLFHMGATHRPTMDFVLASPIVMALTSCLSSVEDDYHLEHTLRNIEHSLKQWKRESSEADQSGKRMMKALFSEGFEDTLELMVEFKTSLDLI